MKLLWGNLSIVLIDLLPMLILTEKQDYTFVKPEYTFGKSRIDFYMEKGDEQFLLEVKGCTLEKGGVGYFPDARGIFS